MSKGVMKARETWISTAEAAKRLKTTVEDVRLRIERGRVKNFRRVGRYDFEILASEVDALALKVAETEADSAPETVQAEPDSDATETTE